MTCNKPLQLKTAPALERTRILTPAGGKADAGQTLTLYKIGLNYPNPTGLLTVNLTVGKRGTEEIDRKRIDVVIKNNVSNVLNHVSGWSKLKETPLYQYGTSPLDYRILLEIVAGWLEVRVISGAYNIDVAATGEVNLTYVYSAGQSVFEN
ncbi:hypothetical protein D3C81_1622780 [compost metagenome]